MPTELSQACLELIKAKASRISINERERFYYEAGMKAALTTDEIHHAAGLISGIPPKPKPKYKYPYNPNYKKK